MSGVRQGAGDRNRVALLALALVTVLVGVLLAPTAARAGAGSLITGTVWADADKDGVRQASEPVEAGVVVVLLTQPGGVVAASTTTNAQGVYSFANVADGTYIAQVTAPSPFTFPSAASGDDRFVTAGNPAPGQPQSGVSAPFSIAGPTQVTALSAGLLPIASISVQPLAQANACDGLIVTGTAPFDATDGNGMDSGPSNCLVRTNDATSQIFAVSVTGLQTGQTVQNVVVDITISSADGAKPAFSGPGSGGLPTGCLVSGVSPASSIATNADGSVTLHCNMGTFSSAVAPLTVPVTPTNASLNNSSFRVTAVAHAQAGDASTSNTVTNPPVQVTGVPSWDVSKGNFNSTSTPTTVTINGVKQTGYLLQYLIVFSASRTKGETGLASPLTFVDKIALPAGAIGDGCNPTVNQGGTGLGQTPGSITCPPPGTPVDPVNGFTYTVSGMVGTQTSGYHVYFFLPLDAAYRAIDPTWVTGNPVPTGTIPVNNQVIGTNGYHDAQGNLNYGTGYEPGWNGTTASGNNVAPVFTLQVKPPAPGIPGSGKSYTGGQAAPGATASTRVALNTDAQTTVVNPMLADVFDVSIWKIASLPTPPAGYLIEYAQGPNSTDLQTGPPVGGKYPFDSSSLRAAAATANTYQGPWSTDPTTFGADWQDTVNMVRLRPVSPTTFLPASSTLALGFSLAARPTYNGGPRAGQVIPDGVQAPNEGGWTDPTNAQRWSTNEALLTYHGITLGLSKTAPQSQYLPGDSVVWTLNPTVNTGVTGQTVHQIVASDTLPPSLLFDANCTQAALPPGVALAYNPATRVVTFSFGDIVLGSGLPWRLSPVRVCTVVGSLTAPGTTVTNAASVTTPDAVNSANTTAGILINGTGSLAVQKSVDHALIRPAQTFTWSLDWANTTPGLPFAAPDVIDVFPWNGDAAPGSLSKRDQAASDFTGTTGIDAALALPTFTAGGSGAVPGTWYYSTASSATIAQDPRAPANTTPAPGAAGSIWQTASQISAGDGFAAVTAVRFVSSNALTPGQQVDARIPSVARPLTVDGVVTLNGLYVDKAELFSSSFPDQPLPTNEPYVLMPGWSIGDLVWIDDNGDGVFDSGDTPASGVPIQVLDGAGVVVTTTSTDASGRWIAQGLPPGTYSAHIPAAAFRPGGPLAGLQALAIGANPDPAVGEGLANKNVPNGDPAANGLSSTPVTFAYLMDASGNVTGGNQPASAASDPGGLLDPALPAGFMNTNMDLAATPTSGIAVVKAADRQSVSAVGQVVTYTFSVTNTGGLPISGITVADTQHSPAGALTSTPGCATATLATGQATSCTASYTVTQADLDHGAIDDTATATGVDATGARVASAPSDLSIPVTDQSEGLTIVKGSTVQTVSHVGEVVPYSFQVTNIGTVTLSALSVVDAPTAPAGPLDAAPQCSATTLAPGAFTTCTATYTVTQADLDNGSLRDQAVANADDPVGRAVQSPPDLLSLPVQGPTATLSIVKTADVGIITRVGQVVHYSFRVTNTGTLTVASVGVTDTPTPPAGGVDATPTCPVSTLVPGASTTCTATYTVTQADIDNGSVADHAVGTGLDPAGNPVSSPTADLAIPVAGLPASLTLEKSADATAITRLGQVLTYTFRVTNTGALTISALSLTDTQDAPAGSLDVPPTCAATTLAPGASTTCAAPYTVTQADLDHGGVSDSAVADAADPSGNPVESNTSALSVPATGLTASLSLVKSSAESGVTALGAVIHYAFLVTNTGTETITGIAVTDDQVAPAGALDAPPVCSVKTLLPGASTSCTATYIITQADLDNARVADTAVATGADPGGDPVQSPPATDILPVVGLIPSLSIAKSAAENEVTAVGDVIHYSFAVTNTGPLTVDGLAIDDTQTAPAGSLDAPPDCPARTLAPGASVVCAAAYTVTQADLDAGSIADSAVARGSDLAGDPVASDPSAEDVAVAGTTASIAIVKAADATTIDRLGQVVTYTFLVTNTGTVTLTDVAVDDTQEPPANALDTPPVCPARTLAPGISTTCVGTYTVTLADTLAGRVADSAVATATAPGGDPVASEPSAVSVPIRLGTGPTPPAGGPPAAQGSTPPQVASAESDLADTGDDSMPGSLLICALALLCLLFGARWARRRPTAEKREKLSRIAPPPTA